MNKVKSIELLNLKRTLYELEQRIFNPSRWTEGEIEIYRRKVKLLRKKILDFKI